MKINNTIITTVIGAVILAFVFYTTSGVAENSKLIAINTNSLNNVCDNIREIKLDLKQIMKILIDKEK